MSESTSALAKVTKRHAVQDHYQSDFLLDLMSRHMNLLLARATHTVPTMLLTKPI